MTTWVEMYHPALPGIPHIRSSSQAVAENAARGWLVVDGTTPVPTDEFLTPFAGDLRYLKVWTPNEVLTSGAVRVAPDGHVITRNANGTARATYDTTEQAAWTVVGAGGGTAALTPTATKTATYTAVVGDLAMMNVAGGATTLTLPTAPANKSQVAYRAIGATTAVPLTVNRGGSTDTIGTAGATSLVIDLADEVVVLQYDAPNTRWLAVASVKAETGLVTKPVRRCMATLSTPVNGVIKNAEMTFRLSTMLPSTTTRWRVRVRNYQLLTEAAISTGASFTGLWHGRQALDSTGQPTGGFTATPTQALGAFTLPADGSEVISSWITASQITGGLPWLFSFAYTGGDTSTGQASSQGQMWYQIGAGSSAVVNQTSASGFSTTGASPFDIRIEYETVTAARTTLFVGDSITFGTAAAILPQQDSFPSIYATRTGSPSANTGIPGVTAAQWAGATTQWKWQRFDPANIVYDQAVILLGTNDVSAGTAVATYKTSLTTVMTSLRALGIQRVIVCTVPPSNLSHATFVKPAASGATSLVLSNGSVPAGGVQLGENLWSEAVTLSASPTANGDGTFTYTTTATTKAHQIGEVVAAFQETLRLGYNTFLRAVPSGAVAAVSLDRVWAATYDSAVPQQEFVQTDSVHPSLGGAARIAEAIPA